MSVLALLLLLASPPALAAPAWDADLHLHPASTVAMFNARCLDGSAPGFYFRKASSPSSATKWKFHFQGGGWCNDPAGCASRAGGLLGSSKTWTPKLSALWGSKAGFYGLMSADVNPADPGHANGTTTPTDNPFGSWNFVWLGYCDGSSQTSDRDEPLVVGGKPVYMRGRAILDAHLHELEAQYQFLSTATEVIVSGTSAGGLSTFLHASFIKSRLTTPGAKLVAVPDAGFWWDTLAYGSTTERPWLDAVAGSIVSTVWNATLRGENARCLSAPPDGNRAKCFALPYAYKYLVDVPTFVVQSLNDPANYGFCWRPPCSISGNTPGSCKPAELEAFAEYAMMLKGNITAAQVPFALRDGHFLASCNQHEETCRERDWWGITINGDQTMNSTFYIWYTQGGGAAGASAIDVAWPGDKTCAVGLHGNC